MSLVSLSSNSPNHADVKSLRHSHSVYTTPRSLSRPRTKRCLVGGVWNSIALHACPTSGCVRSDRRRVWCKQLCLTWPQLTWLSLRESRFSMSEHDIFRHCILFNFLFLTVDVTLTMLQKSFLFWFFDMQRRNRQRYGPRAPGPPKFLVNLVVMCFERRCPKPNNVACLSQNIWPPTKISGCLRYCLESNHAAAVRCSSCECFVSRLRVLSSHLFVTVRQQLCCSLFWLSLMLVLLPGRNPAVINCDRVLFHLHCRTMSADDEMKWLTTLRMPGRCNTLLKTGLNRSGGKKTAKKSRKDFASTRPERK